MRERHYPRDCLVLRVSRLRVLPVYAYCPFVVYTCLKSTSPLLLYHRPYDLRLLRVPTKSLRVARRLSITSNELPRYTTVRKGSRYRFKLSKLTDRGNKKVSGTLSCTKDQGYTARFNAHAHFPRTHDVARGKNLGKIQAIEEVTDIDQAQHITTWIK